ncbi:MAG TPA: carboxypeptidase regulatory-like domain-containing protein [Planctomycetaceae bacterium]|jgi:thiol-disulfide isomerase/thioredoxin|nr:carboxypeptidase regulatory-like domain-containing protein [Planctomycetaceae bacterium]
MTGLSAIVCANLWLFPLPAWAQAIPAAARDVKLPQDIAPSEIAGVVVDARGKPLSDVLVDAWTWYPGDETRTNADGVFRLKPGSAGMQYVELRFSKPGYSPQYFPQQPRGVKNFVVTLDDKTYLEGTVRGIGRKPAAGATIKGVQAPFNANGYVYDGVETETTSDAQGHYRLLLFPSTYEVRVSLAGAGSTRLTGILVSAGQAKHLDIDLKQSVRFEAKVIDANAAKPAEKFVLYSWRDPKVLGISDAKGKIAIDNMLPGKYDFNVGQGPPRKMRGLNYYEHGELGRWWSAQAVNPWQRKKLEDSGWQRNFDDLSFDLSPGMPPVTIEVEQGVVFAGHVYDPDSNPVFRATVAPALTGTGNSLTGDTRYSTKTASDGSYRVVMPAGNDHPYNLMAHDGDYNHWRKWANAVSEPLKTKPGQRFENFDFKLMRGATVRGRILSEAGRVVGNREVRAQAADMRENRYYDPTVKVRADGSFELKFVRPSKQYIQVSPFWLQASDAVGRSSVLIDLKPGEVRERIELTVVPWAQPVAASLSERAFRVHILDHAGKPAANQALSVSRHAEGNQAAGSAFIGGPGGLSKRLANHGLGGQKFAADADGVVTIPGAKLFDRNSATALVTALNTDREEGAIGVLFADLATPEITLRLSPFCDTTAAISTEKLPESIPQTVVSVQMGGVALAGTTLTRDRLELQLPAGDYSLTINRPFANPLPFKFSIRPNQEQLDLGVLTLKPTRLGSLIGKPAPELRGIAEWSNGRPVTLGDLRGKVVVLDFWNWSCPRVQTMPNLLRLHDAFPSKDVAIISVHDGSLRTLAQVQEKIADAKKQFWKGRDMPFPLALAGGGKMPVEGADILVNGRVFADYGIVQYPTTLLIDRQGTVVSLLDSWNPASEKTKIAELLRK